MKEIKEIYLAGGCFWGVEAYFQRIRGVEATEVGYANGTTENPSYHELTRSGHAETVKLLYDANVLSLRELLAQYLRIVDPLSHNKQGNDSGTQYRTGIYYTNETDLPVIRAMLAEEQKNYAKKLAIEVDPLSHFYPAEDDHQNYLQKNPNGYCHINLAQAYRPLYTDQVHPESWKDKSKNERQERLSPLQYRVTQEADTEAAFSSPLDQFFEAGLYVDIVSGQPLFSSKDKYDAGCGWPSFTKPITTDAMQYLEDLSFGRQRVEVKSSEADSHLGHVFTDGPKEAGGLRYCINGAALRFIPLNEMAAEGYAYWIDWIK